MILFSCGPAVDRDLPPAYRDVKVPPGLTTSKEARSRGAVLFAQHCTLCHGVRGDGHGIRSQALSTRPRDFTNPTWRSETSPRHVYFAIREGVRDTAMPAWKSLDEDETWDLVAYVLSLGASEPVKR